MFSSAHASPVMPPVLSAAAAPASPMTEASVRSASFSAPGVGMCSALAAPAGGRCERVASSCVVDACSRLSVCGPLLSCRPKPAVSAGFCCQGTHRTDTIKRATPV